MYVLYYKHVYEYYLKTRVWNIIFKEIPLREMFLVNEV